MRKCKQTFTLLPPRLLNYVNEINSSKFFPFTQKFRPERNAPTDSTLSFSWHFYASCRCIYRSINADKPAYMHVWSILSLAKYSGPDPHKIRAAAYGQGIIMAHPHAHGVKSTQVRACPFDFIKRASDKSKIGLHTAHIISVRGHPHHTADMSGAKTLIPLSLEEIKQLIGREAEFRLLRSHMKLHQNPGSDALLLSFTIHSLKQAHGINTFNQRRTKAKQLLHLVGLQMPYEVPPDIRGERRNFLRKLLHTALAKEPLPGSVGFFKRLNGMKLRYGHKLHPFGQSAAYQVKVFSNAHHSAGFASPAGFSPPLALNLYTSSIGVSLIDTISKSAIVPFIDSMKLS